MISQRVRFILTPMMPSLRIIQLSDCHLSASPGALYRGCHALESLASIVSAAKRWQPDLVVASGDLSDDGSVESYRMLAESFSDLGVDVYLLPGNHDDILFMRSVFSAPPFHVDSGHTAGAWSLYFLDSTIPGNPAGEVGSAIADLLAQAINNQPEPHAFIFMHHQPWLSGSAWIDKYALMHADGFRQVLSRCDKLRAVAWGHVHHGWERNIDGVSWLACPSTVSNSVPGCEKFTPDDRGPACRWLELSDTGRINSGLLYARSQS